MAIDQTAKRQALARKLVSQCENFLAITTDMAATAQIVTDAGLTFIDTDCTGVNGLSHLDAATINGVLAKYATIKAWVAANGADFQKARL